MTPTQALMAASRATLEDGALVEPRGQKTLELTNVTLMIDEPWHLPIHLAGRTPGLSPFIGAVECLQLVGQVTAPEVMTDRSPQFGLFMNEGVLLGAYGPRVYGQLARVVQTLLDDPDSRQAVVTIFDGKQDLGRPEVNDIPCTLSVQFLVRDNVLCARTSMRSNDVFLGLPYDLIQFIGLQGAVAAALGLQMGWYAHTVGSLHLYTKNIKAVSAMYAGSAPKSSSPRRLWSAGDIGEISSRARGILAGEDVTGALVNPTSFERWLQDGVSR